MEPITVFAPPEPFNLNLRDVVNAAQMELNQGTLQCLSPYRGRCAYRSTDKKTGNPLKCVVGAALPDDVAIHNDRKSMSSIRNLIDDGSIVVPSKSQAIALDILQGMHDELSDSNLTKENRELVMQQVLKTFKKMEHRL